MPMPTPRSAPELVSAATVGRIAHPLELPVVGRAIDP
jgi:hypothetical protein